ncbi:MAG: electron transfer flavoprotein subunit beta/FixA family protein [Bacteroidia bacterium]|jgi:electron transfer flavoprotein beta subunit|nr:electron transfer flavoprotein subunit beta/FixA family protein [Bacteroidia bacterium]MDG2041385.1 electron transfer flavoprotein subunit beta/FixA family protein [Bacteroidia bacterium]|tara:strand:- start:6978 stop:7715 length:738 start_codon:yes stop_codon:yes gene_type:complete
MKILVCVSVVPDTTTKITFKDNDTIFDKSGVQFIINPYDELALTRAIEIAETNSGNVNVITVGEVDCDPVIRKALAMGANEAFRVDAQPINAFFVAQQIAHHAKNNSYDLILTGRESIDYNGGMVQGLIAEILNYPIINVVTELEYKENTIEANRDIDGGKETVSSAVPCVVSAQKDLCEPRIPNMRGIMMARSKPLSVLEATGESNYTQVIKYELPPSKTGVKLIDAENAESLIDILHNEEKLF